MMSMSLSLAESSVASSFAQISEGEAAVEA